MKWDRNTIFVVIYFLNFLKPVYVQNVHFLAQYIPIDDVEQSNISSGLYASLASLKYQTRDQQLKVPPGIFLLWEEKNPSTQESWI